MIEVEEFCQMVKLSMPVGLLIEAAIAGGVAGEQLLDVLRTKNMEALRHIEKEEKSWGNLFVFAEENWETIVSAIHDGYTFKFITIRGLVNLLQTTFKLIENKEYKMNESGIDLKLSDDQLDFLRSRIPDQWVFSKQNRDNFNFHAALPQTKQIV
jgi:hypothetical protein